MLGLSLLLHIALLAFVPGFGIFLPAGDTPYIEIETVLLEPNSGDAAGEDAGAEDLPGELTVQAEFSVSEPGNFESPDAIGQWEGTVLEREFQPLEMPETEVLPDTRPQIEPEALSVQLDLRPEASQTAPERSLDITRPDAAPTDEATERAEQPFDLAALREEAPLREPEAEFSRRALSELPEHSAVRPPLTVAQAVRPSPSAPADSPLRISQIAPVVVSDIPEPQLPERRELTEVEEESLVVSPETPRLFRPAEAAPEPDALPDFTARALPESVNPDTVAFVPEKEFKALRPAPQRELLPERRDFQPKALLEKETETERLDRAEPLVSQSDDRIVEAESLLAPEPREEKPVPSEREQEAALPFSARALIEERPQAIFRRRVAVTAIERVDAELSDTELRRSRLSLRSASLPPAGMPVNQAFALERQEPPEVRETPVQEMPEPLRRPVAEATPAPTPIFSIQAPASVKIASSPSVVRPLPRVFADATEIRREKASVVESASLSRSFGSRRTGLLQVMPEHSVEFEDEKPLLDAGDEALEEVEAEESSGEGFELTIEGPASKRQVIYKPAQLPELTIDMEVNIRLKFWVLPDGSVGEVVPLQRGDIRLERAAIQYLKSWRFTPVTDEREVWGIIPIRYSLQ